MRGGASPIRSTGHSRADHTQIGDVVPSVLFNGGAFRWRCLSMAVPFDGGAFRWWSFSMAVLFDGGAFRWRCLLMAGQAHARVVVSPTPHQGPRNPSESDSQNARQETIGPGPDCLPAAGRANRCGGAQSRGCSAALRRRELSGLPVRFQPRRHGRFGRRLYCGGPIGPIPCRPGTAPVRLRASPDPQRPRSTSCLIPSGTVRYHRAPRDPVRRRVIPPGAA